MKILISFFSGILLTIGSAYLSYLFQRRQEKKKFKEKIRFEIYMNLLDLKSSYFWVTSAEIHGEKPSSDIKRRLKEQTWKMCDKLRQIDDIEFQDEILEILLSEKFVTAIERDNKFSNLIEKYHKIVNPNFAKKVKEIDTENMKIWAEKGFSNCNAPGTP
jgi:hypothetical protein